LNPRFDNRLSSRRAELQPVRSVRRNHDIPSGRRGDSVRWPALQPASEEENAVVELLVVGALAVALLAVFGALWAVASLVWWVLLLPFKLLGLLFKGLAFLLALPFLLIAGVVAAIVFGVGAFAFFLPALPFILLFLFIVWLFRRGRASAVSAAR
jgi:hypothetical protein